MPKVGGKHFSYSQEGYRKAKRYAEKTGQSVDSSIKKKKPTNVMGGLKKKN